ncbi:MAG: AraC family transcriptional regulator [Ginsengibacter sp.]
MALKLIIKNKIGTERTIKISPFKKDIRKTNPHKHNNYFEIIYLSNGSGFHYIDQNKYLIKPPVLFFIRQEQVHYWELENEPEGYVLIIKKNFIGRSLDNELKSLFTRISSQCCLQITETGTIEQIMQLLAEESKADDESVFHIMEGLLKSLLAKILQVSQQVINSAEVKSDTYHSFTELLRAGSGIKNKVAFYAENLNTSPQNLNAVCRKATNQSAADVLSAFVLNEAKRLLLYTNNTISEIAFALEFTDPSHFVKYFKKHVGATPKAFRNSN